jgi:hypothetical protein
MSDVSRDERTEEVIRAVIARNQMSARISPLSEWRVFRPEQSVASCKRGYTLGDHRRFIL